MNPPVRRLAVVVIAMFLALMLSTTWVQFFQAGELNSHPRNARTIYREYGRDRGPIIVAGENVAYSTPSDDVYGYQRVYSEPELYAHATGYFSTAHNAMTGIEQTHNAVLGGTADSLLLQRIQNLFTGQQPQGGAVELTLDPAAQRAAAEGLGDRPGAVVAIDPSTGAILAMYSSPSYDPNGIAARSGAEANEAYQQAIAADNGVPLRNRAIAGDQYAPGSSFKIITAAAYLENAEELGLDYTGEAENDGDEEHGEENAEELGAPGPTSIVPGPTTLELPLTDHVIRNPGQDICGDGSGQVELIEAFRWSCNTTFAQIGMDLGEDLMRAQAEAFGFGEPLSVPLSVTPARFPEEPNAPQLAMASIGQGDIMVTPMQMAMVASAVANEGSLMEPYLVASELTPDLDEVASHSPSERSQPISAETAASLQEMMRAVVESGSGTAAAIPGVEVGGKTGSAELGAGEAPHGWFAGFAEANGQEVAVAVVVERGGFGADVAAPIARNVMDAVVGGGS
ncbi:peptidoglycan D,D-transpeptidase FtsI family protein [Bogoriella caseilytica]|uniref:Cell elongation-specific peptidoglycan D,D-transpeptidase n=1 Tax=Bogoriella caseilytica TaxID=56055 RepID=A0A3N2BCH1_9MICO|nr:penicillin-binding protein 2 [Bogoriella caseilytica]ROR72912.1 cell elongation-specific peptidoglycan D,D-transpeptidase [Bogoriella caseilytica]